MRMKARSAVKSSRKPLSPTKRPAAPKSKAATAPDISPEELAALDLITQRYEQSERAWQSMTALPGHEEPWHHVEENILARGGQDAERRWKYFSK